MKFFITMTIAAFSIGVFAQGNLESMKQETTSHLDSKISSLQDAKSCINEADSMDKFKACKYDMHKEMRKQKMEKRQKMEDEQQRMEDEIGEKEKETQKALEKQKEEIKLQDEVVE